MFINVSFFIGFSKIHSKFYCGKKHFWDGEYGDFLLKKK
jgi:hypothetical protein